MDTERAVVCRVKTRHEVIRTIKSKRRDREFGKTEETVLFVVKFRRADFVAELRVLGFTLMSMVLPAQGKVVVTGTIS